MSNHSVDCTYCHEDLRLGHHGGLESLCPQRPGTATSPKTRRCGGLCVLSAGHAGGCFSPVHVLTYEDAANYWLATQDNAPAVTSPSPETPTPRICPNCKQVLRPNEDHFAHSLGPGSVSSGWMCSPPSAPREADRDEVSRLMDALATAWSADMTQHRDAAFADADRLCASIRSRLSASEARVKFLEGECRDWENREAAVCPEDVGFDEFIRHLTRKAAASEARAAAAEQRADAEVEIKEEMFDNWTKAERRLAAAVARIEFLEAEEGRWDRVTDMAFICEAQAQCPHGMPVASKCLTCTNATLAEWAKDVVVLQQRTRLAEARVKELEREREAIDHIVEMAEAPIFGEGTEVMTLADRVEWVSDRRDEAEGDARAANRMADAAIGEHAASEARLASLLEKVERLPRYRARYDRQDSHANGCSVTINVPLDAFEASAVLSLVRSLLAPSEDTSDG